MSRPRIAILGASVACFELAERLLSAGADIGAMVPPRGPIGSGIQRRSASAGLPLLEVGGSINDAETIRRLAALGCDLFVNWGHGERFVAAVLAVARLGVLNLHPGAIPGARGLEPVFGAMVEGWPAITQTVHRMSVRLDDGPIIATRAVPIDDDPYRDAVEERLRDGAAAFYASAILSVLAGEAGKPGDGPSRYFPALTPADHVLDWALPAEAILRRVRALSPFLPARSWIDGGVPVLVWRAEGAGPRPPGLPPGQVVGLSERGTDVVAGDGLVRLTKVEIAPDEGAPSGVLQAGCVLGSSRGRS